MYDFSFALAFHPPLSPLTPHVLTTSSSLQTFAIFWTFAGVVAILITVLVIAKNGRRDAAYVFGHFETNSGWTPGWSFFVGLLHAAYATSSTGMIIS
jgi:hypothetical protein